MNEYKNEEAIAGLKHVQENEINFEKRTDIRLDESYHQLNGRLIQLEAHKEETIGRFNRVDQRFDGMERQLDTLRDTMHDNTSSMEEKLTTIQNRLNTLPVQKEITHMASNSKRPSGDHTDLISGNPQCSPTQPMHTIQPTPVWNLHPFTSKIPLRSSATHPIHFGSIEHHSTECIQIYLQYRLFHGPT